MAPPKKPEKAALVMGVMYSNKLIVKKAINQLTKKFGEIANTSKEFDFSFTKYYDEEFGKCHKFFIGFKEKIDISKISEIKLYTNKLEQKFSINAKRQINLDPGYVTKHAVIVASCKPRPYRIYLGKGVYAQLMFMFRKAEVINFKWTFPDYLENVEFFRKIR